MITTSGPFNPATGQVMVTFIHNGVVHLRGVNACMKAGIYDDDATILRVKAVAAGVRVKIEEGVIRNPPDPVEPAAPEPEEPAGG